PPALPSSPHPPRHGERRQRPRWLDRLAWARSEVVLLRMISPPVSRMRIEHGMPPIADSPATHLYQGMHYLLAGDPVIAPSPPDWTRFRVTPTGPWFYEDPSPLASVVERFLDAGSPPVYVGFGS